jgi:hypothetical protein
MKFQWLVATCLLQWICSYKKLKSNILPFGGINIIYGRFLTISTHKQHIVISKKCSTNLCIHKNDTKKIIRKNVWENYIHLNSIILIEQMQQNKDIQYASIVENLKTCKITNSNFNLLKPRILSNLKLNLFQIYGGQQPW